MLLLLKKGKDLVPVHTEELLNQEEICWRGKYKVGFSFCQFYKQYYKTTKSIKLLGAHLKLEKWNKWKRNSKNTFKLL